MRPAWNCGGKWHNKTTKQEQSLVLNNLIEQLTFSLQRGNAYFNYLAGKNKSFVWMWTKFKRDGFLESVFSLQVGKGNTICAFSTRLDSRPWYIQNGTQKGENALTFRKI